MTRQLYTRREFSVGLAALLPVLRGGGGTTVAEHRAPDDGISRTEESIHQVIAFKASRRQFYEAIMDEKQFARLSGGLSAVVSRDAGGAFSIFGGRITGRHIELVPNERIVQAWRSESWRPGIFSIARFALTEEGSGTTLVFDHTGFPKGDAEHLAAGWKSHYWDPLAAYLA